MLRKFILQHFTRSISPARNYIAAADGLRFIAIAFVFFGHIVVYLYGKLPTTPNSTAAEQIVLSCFASPGLGLNIFFVLSGFLLIIPFAQYHLGMQPKQSIVSYYARRLVRLELPYIVALSVSAFILVFVLKKIDFINLLPKYIASLFYSNHIIYGGHPEPLPIAWSLEAEVQFYIIVPLLAFLFKLKKWTRRIVLLTTIIGIPLLLYYSKHISSFHLIHQCSYFFAGILAADFFLTTKHIQLSKLAAQLIAVLLIAIIIWFVPILGNGYYTDIVALPLPIAAFIYLVIGQNVFNHFFTNTYIKSIGLMSYTIYLWHYMVISGILKYSIYINASSSFLITVIIQSVLISLPLLILSTILFLTIEKPCMYSTYYKKIAKFFSR